MANVQMKVCVSQSIANPSKDNQIKLDPTTKVEFEMQTSLEYDANRVQIL
jgi:hypothetical protein